MVWFRENDHGSKNSQFQEKLAWSHVEEVIFRNLDVNLDILSM